MPQPDAARAAVADLIGATPAEIMFTGGGSDCDILAIRAAPHSRTAAPA